MASRKDGKEAKSASRLSHWRPPQIMIKESLVETASERVRKNKGANKIVVREL